jgi:hypothetical protein
MYADNINASFAKKVNKFKTIMKEISNCNSNIHYGRQCLFKGIILKRVKTKISRSSTATKVTVGKQITTCVSTRVYHETVPLGFKASEYNRYQLLGSHSFELAKQT